MNDISTNINYLIALPVPIMLVAIFILLFSVGFLWFWYRADVQRRMIQAATSRMSEIKTHLGDHPLTDLKLVANDVMGADILKHLWSEYCETLHGQKRPDDQGRDKISRYRATAMAEVFFTDQALVDIPLKTDFFKHLPGIFTGLGIIGTFSGLIIGLSTFQVSGNAEVARASLAELIQSVGGAFIISAIAISLAMFCTLIEKLYVTLLYKQVQELCQRIDSLFDAGVGEEYLALLVQASETSATQSLQLKDALVGDLKEILSALTTSQITALSNHGKLLATELKDVKASLNNYQTSQGDALSVALVDVLANFSEKMEDMFGGQLRGINDLLIQSAETMRTASAKLGEVAEQIGHAGGVAADKMGSQLEKAINSMEVRQELINRQMSEFVEQIKTLVSESQSETSRKLKDTLSELGIGVGNVITQLQEQTTRTSQENQQAHERFLNTTQMTVSGLAGKVDTLISKTSEAIQALQANTTRLTETTTDAITKMNSGAETLFVAASDFAKAGQGVTSTMKHAADTIEKVRTVSQTLVSATSAVQQTLDDQKKTRDAFAMIVADLKATVENAKREASMTEGVIKNLREAAEQLGRSEKAAEEYLRGVNAVLEKVHSEFAAQIKRTLKEGNNEFHSHLSSAVGLLKGGIDELGDTLDRIGKA